MNKLKVVTNALEDIILDDIIIFDLREKNPFFDFFIISSAKNPRQLAAAARDVKHALNENGYDDSKIEGTDGGWSLVDCGDIIVNIFTKEEREYYNIEKMWLDIPKLDKDTL